jgi:DnaK suppressor protein
MQVLHLRTGTFALMAVRLRAFSVEAAGTLLLDHPVQTTKGGPYGRRGVQMAIGDMTGFREILRRKEAELVQALRTRDGIAIEKSADQMDEIQYASERDLAIRNVDRDSILLRSVKAALRRIHEGSFGTCMECESGISPKRLAAVPWATHCIRCQDAADRDGQNTTEVLSEDLVDAA